MNLTGVVSASSDRTLIGTPVSITAEGSSGSVIFVVGDTTFTGAGSVSIYDTAD